MDLEAVWREARMNISQAWTWMKDAAADHPVAVLLGLGVIFIIWRLLRPSLK